MPCSRCRPAGRTVFCGSLPCSAATNGAECVGAELRPPVCVTGGMPCGGVRHAGGIQGGIGPGRHRHRGPTARGRCVAAGEATDPAGCDWMCILLRCADIMSNQNCETSNLLVKYDMLSTLCACEGSYSLSPTGDSAAPVQKGITGWARGECGAFLATKVTLPCALQMSCVCCLRGCILP